MNKRILFPLIGAGALSGAIAIGATINSSNIRQCNQGIDTACHELVKVHGVDFALADRVTNPIYKQAVAELVAEQEAEAKEKAEAERAKAEAERLTAERQAELRAAAAKKRQAEEAAFKAEGWFQLQPGIYGRWCTKTCSNASVIGDARYWLMEVWAKDRSAGDIYARANILKNGVVIGWTNETAYLSKGQKGVLTFSKYLPGSGYSLQVTEFIARG